MGLAVGWAEGSVVGLPVGNEDDGLLDGIELLGVELGVELLGLEVG